MRRIAVRAIIAHEDKLLLVVLHPYSGGPQKDYYCTVGGGLDDGEGLIDGLYREVLEETGVKPDIGRLLFVQQYADDNDNIEFFFHVKNGADFLSVDLVNSSHGVSEIKEIGFYDPKQVTVLPSFLNDFTAKDLEEAQPVRFFDYLPK